MAPNNSVGLAVAMGNLYQNIAQILSNYIMNNIGQLRTTPDLLNLLVADQGRIISYSSNFYSQAEQITFAGDTNCFNQVAAATKAINDNIQKIETTDKWINFAGALITLGASIVSANGSGILASAETICSTFNINLPGGTASAPASA